MATIASYPILHHKTKSVLIATFFSATFYSCYWFYRMFQASGDKRPILKTIFSFIFAFELFPKLYKLRGQSFTVVPYVDAFVYLLGIIVMYAALFVWQQGKVFFIVMLLGIALISIAVARMHAVARQPSVSKAKAMYNGPERAWSAVGGVCLFIIAVGSLLPTRFETPDIQNTNFEANYESAQDKFDEANATYYECLDHLNKEYRTLDESDEVAVLEYDSEVEYCDELSLESDAAFEELLQAAEGKSPGTLQN